MKLGTWVRSSLCVSSKAWNSGRKGQPVTLCSYECTSALMRKRECPGPGLLRYIFHPLGKHPTFTPTCLTPPVFRLIFFSLSSKLGVCFIWSSQGTRLPVGTNTQQTHPPFFLLSWLGFMPETCRCVTGETDLDDSFLRFPYTLFHHMRGWSVPLRGGAS